MEEKREIPSQDKNVKWFWMSGVHKTVLWASVCVEKVEVGAMGVNQ